MSSLSDAWTLLYHVVVTLVAYFIAKFVYDLATARKQRPKPPVLKKDWKRDVVYLYQFPRPLGSSPNMSPYCLKLEMYLRVNKIKYEMTETIFARSAEGKLPFIELNGEQFSDSQLIIEMLRKRFNIQDDLKPEERAVIRLITRTLDHGTFFNLVYHKLAMNSVGFAGALLKDRAPDFVKYLLAPTFYKQVPRRGLMGEML
ncbi:Protein C25H3.7 [Aphelenchoides avenae]|nr:Protein C25H3.7 [Aphelenchus avenae]